MLALFVYGLQATAVHEVASRASVRYHKRGRPGHGARPDQGVYQSEGALASSMPERQARVAQQRRFSLATHNPDAPA